MLVEIKNIKSNKKALKSFGNTIGIILLLVAGFLFFKEKELFIIFIYIAGVFIGLGIMIPIILKPIYLVWMVFAVILGWIMTRIILSLLFYVIITPIGLLLRFFGKDLLGLKIQVAQRSYWNKRDSKIEKNQDYKKQY